MCMCVYMYHKGNETMLSDLALVFIMYLTIISICSLSLYSRSLNADHREKNMFRSLQNAIDCTVNNDFPW